MILRLHWLPLYSFYVRSKTHTTEAILPDAFYADGISGEGSKYNTGRIFS